MLGFHVSSDWNHSKRGKGKYWQSPESIWQNWSVTFRFASIARFSGVMVRRSPFPCHARRLFYSDALTCLRSNALKRLSVTLGCFPPSPS
jgi:hypothetical protein